MDNSNPACNSKAKSGSAATAPLAQHGDVDKNGDLVDELARRLPVAELGCGLPARERAALRNRAARVLLGLDPVPTKPAQAQAPAVPPASPAPVAAQASAAPSWAGGKPTPRARVRWGERPTVAAAPIQTKVPARLVSLDELEPATREHAQRLLAVIPEESVDREAQACLVALALRRAS